MLQVLRLLLFLLLLSNYCVTFISKVCIPTSIFSTFLVLLSVVFCAIVAGFGLIGFKVIVILVVLLTMRSSSIIIAILMLLMLFVLSLTVVRCYYIGFGI